MYLARASQFSQVYIKLMILKVMLHMLYTFSCLRQAVVVMIYALHVCDVQESGLEKLTSLT